MLLATLMHGSLLAELLLSALPHFRQLRDDHALQWAEDPGSNGTHLTLITSPKSMLSILGSRKVVCIWA
jgi:hypothetical protein